MPPPWKVVAASAAACALAVWLLVDDEDENDENAPQLCELCLERPEDQETDMTFGLCYQCGRMHCSTCRKKMMMAQMQKVQLNEPRMFGAKCPWCRSPMESATPRYLLLRELLDRRPKGRHVKHCLFESRAVWKSTSELGCWNFHAIEQTQLRRKYRVDGVGRPKFDFHTGAR